MNPVRARLGEALFQRVAGPDGAQHRERIHGRPGPRWFASGSPIAEVHGDASMFVGGMRALLMQTLHPAAMRAVSEHSGYRGDMWGRLHRTSRFLAVTTFGHEDDAQQAVDVVRAIHERVVGDMPDGTRYAASDPDLLRWVHVAEVDSFLRAHDVYGARRLDPAERDEYLRQTAVVATRLGAVDLPTDAAELRDCLADYRPVLRGTPEAREAVRHVLLAPPLPLAARPPYGVLAAAAVGLMPAWTR
ncbi:MAG: oxygenase MpaB family protein, partial [Nocardioides sp.]